MTCYHPLKAFRIGTTVNGKPDYKICGNDVDHVEYYYGKWHDATIPAESKYCNDVVRDFIEVPCGRCIGCRLDYSRAWADRCMLEMQYHSSSYFVTLTYDDDHLPSGDELLNPDTGEILCLPTLRKRDLQLFFKRLRKAIEPDKIRFMACGEYGTNTVRPHYHAIVFGLKLDDLKLYKCCDGYNLFNSAFLDGIWQKGFVVVGEANWQTSAYVSRYITKKQKGKDSLVYDEFGIEKEFLAMSRKPGIGRQYFDDHGTKFLDQKAIYLATPDGSREIRPPRYFKKLLDNLGDPRYNEVKLNAKRTSDNIYFGKISQSSKSYYDLLEDEESIKLRQIKSLKREEV